MSGSEDVFLPFAVGSTLLLLPTAIAVLRYGGLPRWIAWVSLTFGLIALVALVLGAVAASGVGFIAFLILLLWLPLISTVIYKRQPHVS